MVFKHLKASYVNYYADGAGSNLYGRRVPVLLRLGGAIMDYEAFDADEI